MNNYIFNLFFSLSNFAFIKNVSIFLSDYLIYGLFIFIIIFIFFQCKFIFRNIVLFSIISLGGYLVSKVLKSIFHIQRPFIEMNFIPVVPESGFSFPSSHATVFAALSIFAFSLNKKLGVIFSILTIFIGLSRMVLGVHYPSDILGGFVVGAIFSLAIVRFFKKYL